MTDVNQLITEHLEIWTTAIEKKSSAGRGNGGGISLHGIKKLRELILELAVRGRLLPQSEGDGPGPAVPKSSKRKNVNHPDEKELDFAPPSSWTIAKFGDFFDLEYGDNLPKTKRSETGEVPVYGSNGVVGTHREACVHSPCIVIGRKGSAGALNLCLDETCWVTDVAYSCVPPTGVDLHFAMVLFSTLRLDNLGKGIKPGLSRNEAYALPVAIPPLAEQYRVVAKVDELMALCDALERQTEDSLKAHQTLVETCLATLTNSRSPEDLTENWNRIEAHFDTLFTTEESVVRLETTVLELAIRGFLVSQDPSDEPAATWLERSIRTRDKLVKAKTIRKPKATKDVDGLPKPYALPRSWTWARLPEVGELARGKSKHRPRNDRRLFDGGEYPLVQTGDVARANPFIVESESFYNDFGLQQSRLWPSGTLCITIAANIADTGILSIDACFPDSVVGYIPFEDDVDVTYFDSFIRTAKNDLEHYAPSTAQKNINLEILGEVLVPLPPKKELNRICDRVSDLLKLCKVLRQRIREAQSTSVKLADTLTSKIH